MPRSQNTHAIINAGFNFKVKNDLNTIEEAKIIYGAINTTFTRAKITEKLLSGKQLFDDNTLQEAYQSLDSELQCDISPPDPSPDARKQLAISLFYKVSSNGQLHGYQLKFLVCFKRSATQSSEGNLSKRWI